MFKFHSIYSLNSMWTDERLVNAKLDLPLTQTNTARICPDNVVNLSQMGKIWTPNTYIYNSLNEHQMKFTKFNSFMRLYHNGTVYFWSKILLMISCYMDFTNYPMDRQECSFEIGSSTYDERFTKYLSRRKIKVRIAYLRENMFFNFFQKN